MRQTLLLFGLTGLYVSVYAQNPPDKPTPPPGAAAAPKPAGEVRPGCKASLYSTTYDRANTPTDVVNCIDALDKELDAFTAARKKPKPEDAHNDFFKSREASITGFRGRDIDFGETTDINRYLIRAHSLYRTWKIQLNEMKKRDESARSAVTSAIGKLESVGNYIHRLMAAQGLQEPFAAMLDTGASFSATGNNEVPDARDTTDTEVRGVIRWESKHFLDDRGRNWDWSFGGQIGFNPELTMVQVKRVAADGSGAAGTAVAPNPQVMFRQAFWWDFGPRINVPLNGNFELGAFTRVGQTRLWSPNESFKRGSDSYVAEAITNRTGSAENFYESGLDVRFYDVDVEQAHHEKNSFINPALYVGMGLRIDDRYRRSGTFMQAYDNPRNRWFFRFTVNLNKVIQPRKEGESNSPFAFRFSVDHDHPISESRIPAGTKYTFSTGVDIVKVFTGKTGTDNKKASETK